MWRELHKVLTGVVILSLVASFMFGTGLSFYYAFVVQPREVAFIVVLFAILCAILTLGLLWFIGDAIHSTEAWKEHEDEKARTKVRASSKG